MRATSGAIGSLQRLPKCACKFMPRLGNRPEARRGFFSPSTPPSALAEHACSTMFCVRWFWGVGPLGGGWGVGGVLGGGVSFGDGGGVGGWCGGGRLAIGCLAGFVFA